MSEAGASEGWQQQGSKPPHRSRGPKRRNLCASAFGALFVLLLCQGCATKAYAPGDPTTKDGLTLQVISCAVDWNCNHPLSVSPNSLAGLALWLRADSLTASDGTTLGEWPDQSGISNDATQPVAAAQPTLKTDVLNGHAVVRFIATPTNDRFVLPDFMNFVDVSVFVALAGTTDTGATQFLFHETGSAAGERFALMTTSSEYKLQARNVSGESMVLSQGDGRTAAILSGVLRGRDLLFAFNGAVSETSNASYEPISTWTTPFNQPRIGGQSNAPNSSNLMGDLAEVIFFNRALANWERRAIECHLSNKYAISVVQACH